MPRRPKGSVIRFDPDWDPFRMMYGPDFLGLSSADNTQALGLYNNSTDGSYLVVWDCNIQVSANTTVTPGGLFVSWGVQAQKPVQNPTPNFPLIPNAPVGPGITFEYPNYPGIQNVPYACIMDFNHWQWPHSWPMCYIPPTYSLIIQFASNLSSGTQNGQACYMWQYGVKIP